MSSRARPRSDRPDTPCRGRAATRRAATGRDERTRCRKRSGLDRGLDQMPIDGEPVIRVVLRLAAHRLPLGQHARQQVVLVERLERGDGRRSCRQQIEQRRPSLRTPRSPRTCRLVAQAVEGGRRDRRVGRRRSGPDAQDERAVGHVGADCRSVVSPSRTTTPDARRHDRASRCGCCACRATRRCAATRRRSSTRSCGPRSRSPCISASAFGRPSARATPSCAWRTSCSPRPFEPLHRDSGSHEHLGRRRAARGGPRSRRAPRAPRRCTACTSRRPPRPSFRSGSSRNAMSPMRSWRCSMVSPSDAQPLLAARLPTGRERRRARSSARSASPTTHRALKQPERGLQVAGRDPERLGDRLHAVIERDAGVPDRIPDLVRDLLHVASSAMHEDHVDVAARGELTPAVAPDRDERAVGGIGEQTHEELVDDRRERTSEVGALQGFVGEQRGSPLAERLRVRRFPSPRCGPGPPPRSR